MVAIVLAGGSHSAINGQHSDQPLTLTSISGQPFLYWLTQWLKRQSIDHIVFSAGHGLSAEKIQDAVLHISTLEPDINLDVVTEPRPLGTAGATHMCAKRAPFHFTLVVNGDAILLTDIRPLIKKFQIDDSLDGIMLGIPMDNAGRFGALEVNSHNLLTGFYEKQPGKGLINAGIYLFKNELLNEITEDKEISLERDMFPKWIQENRKIKVISVDAPFIDIGTPENLKKAHEQIKKYAAIILDEAPKQRTKQQENYACIA